MESIGFVLSTAQAVAQVAGVVRRHLSAYSQFEQLVRSVESKSVHCDAAARQMCALAGIPGISGLTFERTLSSLEEIRDTLTSIHERVERWRALRILFFQAPSLERKLRTVDEKLDQLEQHFATVSTLGAMISAARTETRELATATLSAFLSAMLDTEEARRIVAQFEATLQTRSSYDGCLEPNADFDFVMGLKQYDVMPQKFRLMGTAPYKVRCAARYFRRACELGKREAFRYLGDVYCDGIGTQRCYRTAVEYYEQATVRGDAGAKFTLGWCYRTGSYVTRSSKRGLELYNEAIDGGCGEAMEIMGFLKLTPSSYREAACLLKKADAMSVFAAKQSYGLCYSFGLGIERDSVKAFELFNESFQGGNLYVTDQLAKCYDTGSGVDRDPYKAT